MLKTAFKRVAEPFIVTIWYGDAENINENHKTFCIKYSMLDNVKVNKWAMNAEVNTWPCRGVGAFESVDRFEHGSPGFEPGLSLSR